MHAFLKATFGAINHPYFTSDSAMVNGLAIVSDNKAFRHCKAYSYLPC